MPRRGARQQRRPPQGGAPRPQQPVSRSEVRQQQRAARLLFERSGIRRAIVAVVALKLAAIVLVLDTQGLDAFDFPKTVVSHVFAWILAGLLAGAVVRYGHEIVPRTRLHAFVAAVALAWLISAAFAQNTYVAVFGEQDRYEGLTFLADMLVLYLALAVAFRTPRDWATALLGAGAATAASLAYAFLQVAHLDPNKWQLNTQGRPFGTLGHPDMFGTLLAIAFGVAAGVALVADRPRERARRGAAPMLSRYADLVLGAWSTRRIAAVTAGVVLLAGMGVVATRGSALGVAAALVALALVALRLRSLTRTGIVRALGAGAALLALLVGLVVFSSLGSRLLATAHGYAVEDRLVIYENALAAFRDKPLVGWGPDAFAVAYPHYKQARETSLQGISTFDTSAHDWLLETADTTGIVGLGALLALVGAAVLALWRSGLTRMPAVAAPVLAGGAAYWASALVAPNALALDWYPWLVFGAAAAITGTRVAEDPARQRLAVPPYAPAYVAAAIGLVLAYPAFNANREALAAQLSLSAKDTNAAIGHAQAAVANDGGRARYWSVLGAADQLALRWRDAVAAHTQATRRAPYVESYWVNLARSYAGQAVSGDERAGATAAAIAAARQAIATDPNEPVPHATLADVLAALGGDESVAKAEITRAIAGYRGDADFDRIAVEVAAADKDPKDALAFLEGLLQFKDSAALRVGIAQTALRAGDRATARENAQKALRLDPSNADAKSLLASLGG